MDSETTQMAFFGKTYEEALALVVEARDYVAGRLAFDRETVNLTQQLVVDCETLRLTSRLTHTVAWLMIQRAIHDGELAAEQAREEEHRLGGQDVCLFNEADTLAQLPKRLRSLMTRSHALYVRVARLDEVVGESGG